MNGIDLLLGFFDFCSKEIYSERSTLSYNYRNYAGIGACYFDGGLPNPFPKSHEKIAGQFASENPFSGIDEVLS
jgi:hypothetical protein